MTLTQYFYRPLFATKRRRKITEKKLSQKCSHEQFIRHACLWTHSLDIIGEVPASSAKHRNISQFAHEEVNGRNVTFPTTSARNAHTHTHYEVSHDGTVFCHFYSHLWHVTIYCCFYHRRKRRLKKPSCWPIVLFWFVVYFSRATPPKRIIIDVDFHRYWAMALLCCILVWFFSSNELIVANVCKVRF